MAQYLKKETGIRYRLNHLYTDFGEEESKLMDAANAPIEWNKETTKKLSVIALMIAKDLSCVNEGTGNGSFYGYWKR